MYLLKIKGLAVIIIVATLRHHANAIALIKERIYCCWLSCIDYNRGTERNGEIDIRCFKREIRYSIESKIQNIKSPVKMDETTTAPLLSQAMDEYKLEHEPERHHKSTVKSDKSENSWLVPVLVNIFLACASFSILKPNLALYLIQIGIPESFLTWVLFIDNIGGLIGSITIGLFYERAVAKMSSVEGRGAKICFLMCPFFGIVGSSLYASAGWMGDVNTARWFLLCGSFFMGVWSGGQQAVELGEENNVTLMISPIPIEQNMPRLIHAHLLFRISQHTYRQLSNHLSRQNTLQH